VKISCGFAAISAISQKRYHPTAPKAILVTLLAVFVLTLGSMPGWAGTQYFPTVTVSMDACGNRGLGDCTPDHDDPGLNNIMLLFQNPSLFMSTAVYNGTIPSFLDAEVTNFTIPTTSHSVESDYMPTGEMLMGWLDYLPTDGQSPADHVVLFVNSSIAGTLAGHSWDSLFNTNPGNFGSYTEAQILFDLQNTDNSINVIQLIQFMNNNSNLLANPNGGTFDAVAFSTGVNIGSAVGALDTVNTGSGAPEPASIISLALGLSGIAFWKRGVSRSE
jgi:hypothetical protein